MPTKTTRLHGGHNITVGFMSNILRWQGHWSKELHRRRKANKRAKQARKVNRDNR